MYCKPLAHLFSCRYHQTMQLRSQLASDKLPKSRTDSAEFVDACRYWLRAPADVSNSKQSCWDNRLWNRYSYDSPRFRLSRLWLGRCCYPTRQVLASLSYRRFDIKVADRWQRKINADCSTYAVAINVGNQLESRSIVILWFVVQVNAHFIDGLVWSLFDSLW